jgi:hypothetical protein
MTCSTFTKILPALSLFICGTAMSISTAAYADDPTPAPAPAQGRHHRNPAFAACKKQADDQKLERGDTRREFIRSCIKSTTAPPSGN